MGRAYRRKAVGGLLGCGALLTAVGIVLFLWCGLSDAGRITDWRVAVAYLGVIGPVATGLALIAGGFAVVLYRPICAILKARFVALLILCGAVVGTGLLVWGYSWLSYYMQTTFSDADTRLILAADIYHALQPGCPVPFVAYLLWPLQFAVVRDVIAMGGLIGFICTAAAFGIWWERKVAARIQSRLGPMRVGGWHGWAQSPADGIKLILKEDFIPPQGDPVLFRLAPYLAFVPTVVAFMALPFAAAWVFRDLDVALIFILAMLGIDVLGVLCAGLASNNKYSTYGGLREACQMVAYEIPMGMSLLIPVMTVGAMKLSAIADQQAGGFHSWLVFANPWCFAAFFMYYAASLAACKRAPFDLPEAESELVAGFLTEYSGYRWSLFFFGEYAAMFAVSGLATILFLGGWHSPLPASWAPAGTGFVDMMIRGLLFDGPILFILKSFFLFYVQLWVRWTLPRVRIDQVLYACVQVLLPLAMVVLLCNAFWVLGVRQLKLGWLVSLDAVLHGILVVIGYLAAAAIIGLAAYGYVNRTRLVGKLAIKHLPGA